MTNPTNHFPVLQKTVQWNSMYPLLQSGQTVDFIPDYYNVNDPEAGDIVWYDYGWNNHMLIKFVKATDRDNVVIKWNSVVINGRLMRNSAWEVYSFNSGELGLLEMYIKDWKIPKWSYLLFGDNVTDSTDSRKFWVVSKRNLLGKFDIYQ